MTANTLPTEILLRIFTRLDEKDIFSVIQVCRRWMDVGKLEYYKEITIKYNGESGLYASKPARAAENTHLVKVLNLVICQGDPTEFSSEETPNIIKLVQPFTAVKSFNYTDEGAEVTWNGFWKILHFAVLSMSLLESIYINRSVTTEVSAGSPPDELVGIEIDPSHRRQCPRNLKKVKASLLYLLGSQVDVIEPFLKHMLEILGDGAEDLISEVDVTRSSMRLNKYNLPHTWKLRNLEKLIFHDTYNYLLTYEISADFPKLKWLSILVRGWALLCNEVC
ncbi:hypothetical protein TWF281_010725 [Arthrobotrys megalospora]